MEFGKMKFDGERSVVPERKYARVEEAPKKTSIQEDLPRLLLLLFMLVSAIAGGIYNYRADRPEVIVRTSMKVTLDEPFRASIEGSTSLKHIMLDYYRLRQTITDGGVVENENLGGSSAPPFDARSAVEALSYASEIVEYDHEDMYGHGTRHFAGILTLPERSEVTHFAFEYWSDIRSNKAVRLIVTKVERNAAVDDKGVSVAKETYLNIRYY